MLVLWKNAVLAYLNPNAPEFYPCTGNDSVAEEQSAAAVDPPGVERLNLKGDFRTLSPQSWQRIHRLLANKCSVDSCRDKAAGTIQRALRRWRACKGGQEAQQCRPGQPILEDVLGSRLFAIGDEVLVIEGPFTGKLGVISKPGGNFTVSEGGKTLVFEGLCSVSLHEDPQSVRGRVMSQDQLEMYECTARSQLQSGAAKTVRAMEMNAIPQRCHHLLSPLLQKSLEIIKSGTAQQCERTDAILMSRLGQLTSEIFGHLAGPQPTRASEQ